MQKVILTWLFAISVVSCNINDNSGNPNLLKVGNREIAAIINSDTIFVKEIDHLIENEIFELRKKNLFDEITHRILLSEAQKQNISVEELIKNEIAGRMLTVTDNDVAQYMREGYNVKGVIDQNSDLYKRSKTNLENENFKKRQNEYLQALVSKGLNVRVLLKSPGAEKKVNLDSIECFSQGNRNSPIKVFVVSDYMCAACKEKNIEMQKLYTNYGDKVEFYSILFADNISNAELAAMAAGEQRKFWEMHNLIFENQHQLNDELLFGFAKILNLDIEKFKADITSEKIRAVVEKNIKKLHENEITSVPIVIINGKIVPKDYRTEHIEAIIKRMLRTNSN